MKACPFCAEEIQDAAVVCRHCGRELVPQTTPEKEALTKSAGVLEQSILNYTNAGWVLVSRTDRMAQLKKPKKFNWGWFLWWLLIGMIAFALPVILYLIYYAAKKDELVTLSISDTGELLVNGGKPAPVTITKTASVPSPNPEQVAKSNKKILIVLGILAFVFVVLPIACSILGAIANSFN